MSINKSIGLPPRYRAESLLLVKNILEGRSMNVYKQENAHGRV
jgi:hypothetical protein